MKVCLVSGLVSLVVGLTWRLLRRDAPKPSTLAFPVWGLASVALTPSTLIAGTLAVLAAQRLIDAPGVPIASYFSEVSRSGVFVMLAILFAAMTAAVLSLIRREEPRTLPVLGLIVNLVLTALFWHFRFHAPGFGQDTWAPR